MNDALPAEIASGPTLGAPAPAAGHFVITGGGGLALVIPQLTVEGRVGLGANTSLELRYRNLAVLGHTGQARFTWAVPITARWAIGLAARTQIGSIGEGIEVKTGIDTTSFSLGNDWEVGQDIIVTWSRPGQAHVTWSLGPTYALAGPRYIDYDEKKFQWDARWQSVLASVIGEWSLSSTRRLFLRLDALFLVKADIVPYGFLPTFTAGHAWSI